MSQKGCVRRPYLVSSVHEAMVARSGRRPGSGPCPRARGDRGLRSRPERPRLPVAGRSWRRPRREHLPGCVGSRGCNGQDRGPERHVVGRSDLVLRRRHGPRTGWRLPVRRHTGRQRHAVRHHAVRAVVLGRVGGTRAGPRRHRRQCRWHRRDPGAEQPALRPPERQAGVDRLHPDGLVHPVQLRGSPTRSCRLASSSGSPTWPTHPSPSSTLPRSRSTRPWAGWWRSPRR